MANKVLFGMKNIHVGTFTEENGVVTMGAPYHQKGAVGFSPEPNDNRNDFYADDIIYWSGYSGEAFSGDLEVAMFDDEFKTQFLGYRTLTNGGLAAVKNGDRPNVYIAFEIDGDSEKRRAIFYNCSLGSITRNYATKTENTEPVTESIPVTVNGDNVTGATMATFKPSDTGYETLFTEPAAPAFATGG